MLLQALASLRNKGINFLCKITGYGPEKEKLERFISEKGMMEQVKLLGVLDKSELWQLQADADIFVAPGYEESWGIRINEALQSGCPVVFSDRIGAAELVVASGGGATFPAGSKGSLEQVLEDLLIHPDKLIEMKRRVAAYREKIHPRIAAQYLCSVISHSLDNDSKPGTPVWLMADDTRNTRS
jgi:glycosyltransferase involved in cell wall biosynthesis